MTIEANSDPTYIHGTIDRTPTQTPGTKRDLFPIEKIQPPLGSTVTRIIRGSPE
jgi:hypothetical protein